MSIDHATDPSAPLVFYVRLRVKPERVDEWLRAVHDIVEAIEGPIALTACVDHGRHDCCIEQSCRVKPHWNAVNGAVRSTLAGVTLATLSTNPEPA